MRTAVDCIRLHRITARLRTKCEAYVWLCQDLSGGNMACAFTALNLNPPDHRFG